MCGLLLFLFRNLSIRALLWWAAGFFLLDFALFFGLWSGLVGSERRGARHAGCADADPRRDGRGFADLCTAGRAAPRPLCRPPRLSDDRATRTEEHTSELQSLMRT